MLKQIKTISLKTSAILIGLISLPTLAIATDDTTSTRSISYSTNTETGESEKDALLKQSKIKLITPMLKQGYRTESGKTTDTIKSSVSNYAGDFSIYNVSTNLISDFDYDNFYHRFSITIDADTVYESAAVYAKLYLSYEGGPWNYYTSSDTYHIYAESGLDAFVIETELADGFSAGYYDVRIELYDADYNQWLLSYGPYDDSSINSLPLEDSFKDSHFIDTTYPVETEVVFAGSGSMSFWLLAIATLLLITVRFKATSEKS
ncbi:MAG: hypothetical protein DIZ80_07840 [endosymbiont of Galathealinum brachiosum]|uniref:GlyGly-CTERM sorting domain-containing protein n=1 Tax=endosymbiont of Galathealinum brachiosum TaxID=2200906 RepID=A0A370DIP2_9GAMM|nr:MAG: hypothetical protein DIZ80_07840 [endosymbiont of Galathealinum brachiosum]